MRPDGATPDGVLDLAGNVAEWTVEPGGAQVARGGSFRSRVAGELKSWAVEERSGPSDHVGFRCVYDSSGAQ
jgi:formylglycine-generating enzyme required for sulfatase activity